MGQHLATLNSSEPLLDLSQEPVVVLDRALHGFQHEHFRGHAPAIGRQRKLRLEVGGNVQVHDVQ